MMNFRQTVSDLLNALRSASQEQLNNPSFTREKIFRNWLSSAYDEPGFLVFDGYLSIANQCREKAVSALSLLETRVSITFCVRKMRSEYPPYSFIINGVLEQLLTHYLDLTKEAEE